MFCDGTTIKILFHEDRPTDSSSKDHINPKYSVPQRRNQDVYVLNFGQLEDFQLN